MPEVPTPEWTVEQYEQWLRDAFEYLQNQWTEEDGPSNSPWVDVARRGFVESLRLSESQVDTATEFTVLRSFLTYVDERFSDDIQRRTSLLDENQRHSILDECVRNSESQSPPTQRVDTFYWVPDDRARTLGSGWQNLLRQKLDETYPAWQQNTTPENLLTWLDMYWSWLVAGQASPTQASTPPADDPRTLAWVTTAQRARLELFRASRGDWTSWLPGQLDTWWPDWAKSAPETLAPWLDQALPALGAPPAAPSSGGTAPAEEAAVLDDLRGDDAFIRQIADESGVTEDAVRRELAGHSADIRSELAKFMQDAEKEFGLR